MHGGVYLDGKKAHKIICKHCLERGGGCKLGCFFHVISKKKLISNFKLITVLLECLKLEDIVKVWVHAWHDTRITITYVYGPSNNVSHFHQVYVHPNTDPYILLTIQYRSSAMSHFCAEVSICSH